MMDRIVSDKLRAFAPTALVSRRLTPRRVESKRMNDEIEKNLTRARLARRTHKATSSSTSKVSPSELRRVIVFAMSRARV